MPKPTLTLTRALTRTLTLTLTLSPSPQQVICRPKSLDEWAVSNPLARLQVHRVQGAGCREQGARCRA